MSFARWFRRQKKRRNEAVVKRRRKVLFEPLEPRLLLDATGLDPDPVLIIPGFGGTLAADTTDQGLEEWFTNRGITPDKLCTDPVGKSYDNLITTFENIGYTRDENLFVANWDWRVPVAPQDGTNDGVISDVTGQSISDAAENTEFETGLDYLGYWLKKAETAW